MADEVIALRAGSMPEAPQAQPTAGIATALAMLQQQSSPATVNNASNVHASQAAAEDLHHQADAAIPAGSQLADSLALASSRDGKASQEVGVGSAVGSTASDLETGTDQQDSAAISVAEGTEGHVSPEAAGGSNTAAAGKMPPPGVTVLRSNPRFAIKPVKPALDADAVVVNGQEEGLEGSTTSCCIRRLLPEWQHVVSQLLQLYMIVCISLNAEGSHARPSCKAWISSRSIADWGGELHTVELC